MIMSPTGSSEQPRPPIWVSGFTCRDIIRESNNLITAFKISDGWAVNPYQIEIEGTEKVLEFCVPIKFVIVLIFTCEIAAKFDVEVKTMAPSGKYLDHGGPAYPGLEVLGGSAGLTHTIDASFPNPEHGTYWFEVFVNYELRLKLPLEIVRAGKSPTPPDATAASQ
jgi:hypothetical protein